MPQRQRVQRRATWAVVMGLLVTACWSLTAFAETTLEKAKRQGYIRIGFANEAPFGYATPEGKLTGEAPEVAEAILAKMGIPEIDGVLTEFGSLIPGIQAGRFDIIAAGMFITPRRCQQIDFSEPSYGIGQALLVQEGNPKNLHTYADVAKQSDVKLAVMAGAIEQSYARDAGVAMGQLMTLPDPPSLLAAVQAGRADAAALTALSIVNLAAKGAGVEATEPFATVAGKSVMGHGAFGFRKGDDELRTEFNKHLKAFLGTEEHLALVKPFGFGEGFLPTQTTTALCEAS